MSTESSTVQAVPTGLEGNWRYLMGTGIVIAVLGVLAILAPLVSGIAVSLAFGVLLLGGGLVHVVHAFTARDWTGSLWQFVLAAVYTVAGLSLLLDPVVGLVTLTILLVAYFAVDGLVEIGLGLRTRPDAGWTWLVASGVVSLGLAVLLWVGLPSTALWAVGLLLGISLLTSGISLLGLANVGRKATVRQDVGGANA
jgi:uncharacterized membrane protein HdeD (DUF308 family)